MTYTDLVKQRTIQTSKAFKAIQDARGIIDELEGFAVQTAEGKLPDLGMIAGATNTLRSRVDRILVSLTEARMVQLDDTGNWDE